MLESSVRLCWHILMLKSDNSNAYLAWKPTCFSLLRIPSGETLIGKFCGYSNNTTKSVSQLTITALTRLPQRSNNQLSKSKSVPLHALVALGGEKRCSSYSFLTSALDGGWVVSVTPRPRFAPGERIPGTHCTGGWVGPRAGLNLEVRGKILSPAGDRTQIARHYTDWATPARQPFKSIM
jgi:hypothetical protein